MPQVSRARRDSLTAVASAGREATTVVALTSLLPKALGAGGARSWMVGAANTAELRGRSGYMGAFAFLKADQGHIVLSAFQGVDKLPVLATAFNGPDVAVEYRDHYRTLGGLNAWPNLTMSPNFPSGADLLLSRLQASGGPVCRRCGLAGSHRPFLPDGGDRARPGGRGAGDPDGRQRRGLGSQPHLRPGCRPPGPAQSDVGGHRPGRVATGPYWSGQPPFPSATPSAGRCGRAISSSIRMTGPSRRTSRPWASRARSIRTRGTT